jgi:hypothetical protein
VWSLELIKVDDDRDDVSILHEIRQLELLACFPHGDQVLERMKRLYDTPTFPLY